MKLGIGAIPQNLIIKSGGYTYYPLNQFEIDGTVAVELYRQDPEGEKRKIFIFKGEKDELKKFKTKFPVIKEMRSYNEYGSGSSRKTKMVSTNTSDSYLLYKLAENLSAEAANFNKKIKTGARLTPNEQLAVKKSGTTMINVLRKLDENKIIDQKLPKSNAFTRRKPIAVKKAKSPATKKPAVKKIVVKKPAAAKKATTKKSPLRQTGSSNKKYDERFNAMKPGKRTSAAGNVYYERRADHSDKGKKL
jgi:hypothetical protein